MDLLLSQVTHQAMTYAIRSGIAITSGYAIKQCSRLLQETPRGEEREELVRLRMRLESKIRIISPSIDMIELIAARGNTSLESAVSLTKSIRYEIQKLGKRLSIAANDEELLRQENSRARSREDATRELKSIIAQIKDLLVRIEDAVPLINLAITTSGVNLSTKLSNTISPSRLLQASAFLTGADSTYSMEEGIPQQVGPTYVLTQYMLFAGHAGRSVDEGGVRETTWKEVIHKARVKLWRVPIEQLYSLPGEDSYININIPDSIPAEAKATEFAYQLVIVEDLDDDRVHTREDDELPPGPFDGVARAGIRDVLPIHEVSKIFYADTGKILNIGGDDDVQNPVLLLKRDVHAEAPRRMMQRSECSGYFDESMIDRSSEDGTSSSDIASKDVYPVLNPAHNGQLGMSQGTACGNHNRRLPPDLDPEWIAFEVYTEAVDSDSDTGYPESIDRTETVRPRKTDHSIINVLSHLTLRSSTSSCSPANQPQRENSLPPSLKVSPDKHADRHIKTTLSLFEMLIKLTALQQFRQESHLAIEDELLNFFLEDSATAGAGSDKQHRQRIRHDALRRVGFDPYDESPIKRRGEEYIQHTQNAASPRSDAIPQSHSPTAYSDHIHSRRELSPQPLLQSNLKQLNPNDSHSKRDSVISRLSYQAGPSAYSTPDHHRQPADKTARSRLSNSQALSQSPALATPPSTAGSKQDTACTQGDLKDHDCTEIDE